MKTTTVILLLCVFAGSLQAQQVLKKHYLPGVVRLQGDYLYIAETEVSNLQYREYLYWLKAKGKTAEYQKALPDTTVWREKLAFNEPFVQYYLRHPAYSNYPVVGITQSQAQDYCRWVADRIMEYDQLHGKSPIDKIIVRLPSEKEWMKAARGSLPETAIYPWPGDGIRMHNGKQKDEGKIRLNCKSNFDIYGSWMMDASLITTPVISYWPNSIGLYNMSGNVAEWVEETGKSKGGSWNEPPYNARIDVPGMYDGDSSARSTIGFRYVIEVVSCDKKYDAIPEEVNAKTISRQLGYVPDSGRVLFASVFETDNLLYNTFLSENTGDPSLRVHAENWDTVFRYAWFKQYHRHSAYNHYPAVNVSYESAVKFCKWLTDKYNNSEKRPYKKVIIRLPSEKEWELAAYGGRDGAGYPWGGPFTRNSRGCYLANFCPLEEEFLNQDSTGEYTYHYPGNDRTVSRPVDGAEIPAQVDAYFPNDYGLFNCAGNAAEMVAEKGISKGGSWNSQQYFIRIDSKEYYTSSSPYLGFRFFMEVLEK